METCLVGRLLCNLWTALAIEFCANDTRSITKKDAMMLLLLKAVVDGDKEVLIV